MDKMSSIQRDLIQASDGGTTADIRNILTRESALEALFDHCTTIGHILGFFQLRLGIYQGRYIRLHLWGADDSPVLDEAGDIHSHLWGFRSHILAGSLCNTIYDISLCESGPGDIYEVRYHPSGTKRSLLDYKVDWSTREALQLIRDDSYVISNDDFHSSGVHRASALTLIVTDAPSGRPPYVVRESARPSEGEYPYQHLSKPAGRKFFETVKALL
jgi:hypothetical protein